MATVHETIVREVASGERVVLRDGLVVSIRRLRRADRPRVLEFLGGLSIESRFMRFLGACVDLERE
jgi:hypothetical protein